MDDIKIVPGDMVAIPKRVICHILYRLGIVEGYLLNEMGADPDGVASLMVDYCRDIRNQIGVFEDE